jgi:hypothetical protein
VRRCIVAFVLLLSFLMVAPAEAAPVTPTNVVASQASTTSIKLTWDVSPDPNFSYFAVRRCDAATCPVDQAQWTRLAPNFTTPTATESGLTTGHTYKYYVTEIDTSSAVSGRSNVAQLTLTAGTGNPTPTGTKIFDGSVEANWPVQHEAAEDRITDVPDPLGQLSGTVLKFTVDDNDTIISPNPRAQLETNNFVNPGDEIWYGGKILFPSDFPTVSNSGWVSLSSVYGPPYAGASPAPMQIVKCGCDSEPNWGLVNENWTTRYWGFPMSRTKGQWHTWLIHEKFSNTGWMEVWVDGVNVMPRRNMDLISSANDGGANHISQTFYRQKGMWPGRVTMYHAQFGVWKVQ